MKKLLAVFALAAIAALPMFAADAAAQPAAQPAAAPAAKPAEMGFGVGIWFDYPAELKNTKIDGLALGIPVVSMGDLDGVSLALCVNRSKKTSGFEFAWIGFNSAEALDGMQLAFVNLQDKTIGDFGLQVGIYNQSGKNGLQFGLINNGRDNATFQLGLININKNGWLPVMIFVNFGRSK